MEKPIRKVRAVQPMTSDPLALHRVDTKHLADNRTRMVAGTYEQRPMPIDVAQPDTYDLRGQDYDDDEDAGIEWLVLMAAVVAVFFAFCLYIISVNVPFN